MSSSFQPPPYGYRKTFIPRNERDFGDGGAFPEIHIAQYPMVSMPFIKDLLHAGKYPKEMSHIVFYFMRMARAQGDTFSHKKPIESNGKAGREFIFVISSAQSVKMLGQW